MDFDPYSMLMDIWPLLTREQQEALIDIASVLAQYAPPQESDAADDESEETDD